MSNNKAEAQRIKELLARAEQALKNTSLAIDQPHNMSPVTKVVAVKTVIDVLAEDEAWSDMNSIVGLCHQRMLLCRNRLAHKLQQLKK